MIDKNITPAIAKRWATTPITERVKEGLVVRETLKGDDTTIYLLEKQSETSWKLFGTEKVVKPASSAQPTR